MGTQPAGTAAPPHPSIPPAVRTPSALAAALNGTASLNRPKRSATAAAADEEAGSVGELWLYGVVGGWWRGFNAESVAAALRVMDVDTLYVRVHSPGGDAFDGVAIGNLLRNHRATVVVIVDGMAASAASAIAMAGDRVVMCPGSQMMLHDASTFTYGNEAQLARDSRWIGGQSVNLSGLYALRAGGTPEAWRGVMLAEDGEGTWYTADAAVAAKLADEVGTRPAVSSPPTAPDADDLEDDDDAWAKAAHDLQLLEACVPPKVRAAWLGKSATAAASPPKPPTASAGGSTQPEGAAVVDLNDTQIANLREQVGFAEDADADTIVQATLEALNERSEPTVVTNVGDGMTAISSTQLEDLQTKADAGSKAATQLLDMQCKAVLDKYQDRFPATPEARTKWEADFKRDPAGTEAYLSNAAVVVPTGEVGHGDEGEATSVSLADVRNSPEYKNWKVN